MDPSHPRNTVPPVPPQIDSRDFEALREFLRGYLHEDYVQEYGTMEKAVQQFARDADPQQRAEVARGWMRFVELTRSQPLQVVVRLLTSSLGSAWLPNQLEQLEELTRLLQHMR